MGTIKNLFLAELTGMTLRSTLIFPTMMDGDLDEALDNINKCIINAADSGIPKTSSFSKHRKPYWKTVMRLKRTSKIYGVFFGDTHSLKMILHSRGPELRLEKSVGRLSMNRG